MNETRTSKNFIQLAVAEDLAGGLSARVHTRFPPEPNGYLHIGHAKAICVNFEIAREFDGLCNLRFDDTNPATEETEYVEAIREDVRWLGFDWNDRLFYASDYFGQLYEWARRLVEMGKAYVCDLGADEVREHRGTLTEPGRPSPWRERSREENLDLLRRMRAGEFAEGSRTLRAKIDMASPNLNLRDPVMYRILHAPHHRTGTEWHIYPTYDWAHGQSDSLEGITHSLCSLEFENHRPLYDWFLEQLGVHRPRQIEFARLNVSHTVVTKRVLRELVAQGHVDGWDDPRMPTLRGMRRRGFPPQAVRAFCDRIGVAKDDNLVDFALLEHFVRDHWNRRAPRTLAVLRPLRLVIETWAAERTEWLEVPVNPEDESAGVRRVPFGRELLIEDSDFEENPPAKYFRLGPGREVRLRGGYFVTCVGFAKDTSGRVTEVRCTHDPRTGTGQAPDGRRPKGTIHWICAEHSTAATVRLYDHLFSAPDVLEDLGGEGFREKLNPASREVLTGCRVEKSLALSAPGSVFQFERLGYFCIDSDSRENLPVLNRTVSLRDTWAKIEKRTGRPTGNRTPV